ncbi:TPA: hypothetical protein N0H21_001327 [Pseudomonas aeruginosa]|nr:hypothetical protein [Pseudomonas aeruginosa]
MIFKEKEITMLEQILNKKIGFCGNIIDHKKDYTEARLFLTIKSSITNLANDKPKINSLSLTAAKSIINYNKKITPNSSYIGLKEYSRINNFRIGAIKKILNFRGYIVMNSPTGKSFRMNVVFTTLHKYKNTQLNSRIPQLLTLWKKDFLDNLIKRNIEEFKKMSESYSYSKPRSINECTNLIKLHYEHINKIKFTDIYSAIEHIKYIEEKYFDKNTTARLKILKRYVKFFTSNYA